MQDDAKVMPMTLCTPTTIVPSKKTFKGSPASLHHFPNDLTSEQEESSVVRPPGKKVIQKNF